MNLSIKEAILLNYLRENSRISLVKISKDTKIPVSTLFETLKGIEKSKIKKHTTFVDFSKLGYGVRCFISLKSKDGNIKDFLKSSLNVNTMSSSEEEFLVECYFKEMKELSNFKEKLHSLNAYDIMTNFILDEYKKEGLLI